MIKKLVIGNWKMNGGRELADLFLKRLSSAGGGIAVCVPYHLIVGARSRQLFGGQDCSAHASGAYTGEVSAGMLSEAGAEYVIVGHSERRRYWSESDELVSQKAARAVECGITPIICVGESAEEKEAGRTLEAVGASVKNSLPKISGPVVVAYEPLWAVGAGKTPAAADIRQVHEHAAFILHEAGFGGCAVIYGGGVNEKNAKEIMSIPGVGGVLVGGASLDADKFQEIINARG
ncbi:MAG: triose-phosphate isomerase [Rickettsiales bacterium]|nr:triose-phosphate isomerase [Rickettsiales bacterium]